MIPAWKRVILSIEGPGSTWSACFFTLLYCTFASGMLYFTAFRMREKSAFAILITGFFAAWGPGAHGLEQPRGAHGRVYHHQDRGRLHHASPGTQDPCS